MNIENLIAVIANIHGIGLITRNKMIGAAKRGEMDTLEALINHNPNENAVKPEVQTVLAIMLTKVNDHIALLAKFNRDK